MVVDIWSFGEMMRLSFLDKLAFSNRGKTILLLLGTLLISGWVLVASG